MQVRARQGDTLDLLCHRHLGATAGVTEQALALNPGLPALGAELPMGTAVQLPEAPDAPVKTRTKLWD
ncbi:tail protein X [Aromatoleum toluclasticum]|uniref:Tail protein X n=2 Tax=Rhodocyclales TaxID=206389 RepID=A0A944DAW9_DENI1|nr:MULTISPECIES: tail protein X [Rhodocyclales]MBT0961656.1 tail protein X [Denitromonas iodatirespirans]MCC4118820.1 tail protein X [Aromatoleum toluclasticum]